MSYLNTKEVADLLNYSQRTIQRLVKENKLLPINPKHTKGYLFAEDYVNKIANQRKEANNG
ncbi:helix-turn-helix domain-containing protein [Flavivirga jejuensis]|uniref:helix-turn-helix domain-containing protein n=1 Tax=Flavivirga jejuensis TaxID=870487 RepID=UPI00338B6EE1